MSQRKDVSLDVNHALQILKKSHFSLMIKTNQIVVVP